MVKHLLIFSTILLVAAPLAMASNREDDVARTEKAAQVFKQIMDTPDQGIPNDLLGSAKCVAIIPGDKKFAFIFGGSYGRGVVTCRTAHGWSAPMFLAIDGGSVGYQIGGSSTDLVMLFMNDRALHSLLSDKFKLGADASVGSRPRRPQCSRGHGPEVERRDPFLFPQQRRLCRGESGWSRGSGKQEWGSGLIWSQRR